LYSLFATNLVDSCLLEVLLSCYFRLWMSLNDHGKTVGVIRNIYLVGFPPGL